MANIYEQPANTKPVILILWTGLLVGSLDILSAIKMYIFRRCKSVGGVKYIASGVFGNEAFAGGGGMIAGDFFFIL